MGYGEKRELVLALLKLCSQFNIVIMSDFSGFAIAVWMCSWCFQFVFLHKGRVKVKGKNISVI